MRLATKIVLVLVFAYRLVFAAEWYVDYEKAVEAIQNQQWQRALQLLNAAIANKSDSKANAKTYGLRFIDYFPYLYRGVAFYHLGDYARSFEDLKKEERFGELGRATKDRSARQKLQQYLNLLEQQKKPAEKPPESKPPEPQRPSVEPLFNEGVALFNQKNFDAAREKFNAVLRAEPNHAQAANYLKMIEDEITRARAAQAESEKRERINREFNTGVELYKKRDFAGAEQQFQNVLALESSHADALKYLDLIRREKRKFEVAAPVKPEPEPEKTPAGTPAFDEAVALFESGDLKNAKAKFLQVRASDARASDYLNTIADAEQKMEDGVRAYFEGNYDQAITELGECAKRYAQNAHLQAFLACAYAAKYYLEGADEGKLVEYARAYFSKAKQLDPSYRFDERYFSPRIIALFARP
jgi:TolA-binding protein